eukprot:1161324-Pelagomonas_calceolata.AAC.3
MIACALGEEDAIVNPRGSAAIVNARAAHGRVYGDALCTQAKKKGRGKEHQATRTGKENAGYLAASSYKGIGVS